MPQCLACLPHPCELKAEAFSANFLEGACFGKKIRKRIAFESHAGLPFSGMNIAFTVAVAQRQNGKNEESVPGSRFVIRIKRVYEKPTASDGSRLLIDRVWPRGLKKSDLALDGWLKEVAPSDRLRKWFGHDPRKWQEFRRRYFAELRVKAETWAPILARARESNIALLYGARDPEHNNAMALNEFLTAKSKS